MIELTIPGRAVPQSRPRVTMRGGRAHAYEAGPIVKWKQVVLAHMIEARPDSFLPGPIRLGVCAHYVRPSGQISKKNGEPLKGYKRVPYPNGYDVDNIAKVVMDCGTRAGWWRDDGEVGLLVAEKKYTTEAARLVIFAKPYTVY